MLVLKGVLYWVYGVYSLWGVIYGILGVINGVWGAIECMGCYVGYVVCWLYGV